MAKKISTETASKPPKGVSGMDVVWVGIDELKHDPQNARKHGMDNLNAIEASFKEFGQEEPIIATRDNTVIAGNGRLTVAKKLGWKGLWVKYTDLSGAALKAYAIAANRTSELARWDDDNLAVILAELKDDDFNHLTTGFTEGEIEAMLGLDSRAELDPDKEWEGMPSFETEDRTSFRKIIVHFMNQEDVDKFAALTGSQITGRTKSMYYPPVEQDKVADIAWEDGEGA